MCRSDLPTLLDHTWLMVTFSSNLTKSAGTRFLGLEQPNKRLVSVTAHKADVSFFMNGPLQPLI